MKTIMDRESTYVKVNNIQGPCAPDWTIKCVPKRSYRLSLKISLIPESALNPLRDTDIWAMTNL